MRRGITLVEVCIAAAVLAVVLTGFTSVRTFAAAYRAKDATLDQIKEMSNASELISRDLRDAREVIHPPPGAPPARMIYFRNFEGQICVLYYSSPRRELRRAVLALSGLPIEDQRPPARDLDNAYFQVSATGLVSWGLFVKDSGLLGSTGRKNQ